MIHGIVYDKDSITPMPFVYIVNKNSSTGTLSDETGKFQFRINLGDTLVFSFLGYSIIKVNTKPLKDSVKNNSLAIKVFLQPESIQLKDVIIIPNSFTKGTKQFYLGRIAEYKRGITNPIGDPVNALYYALSRKGKELKKLSAIYDQLLIDEMKDYRLSDERIRFITHNDSLNVQAFRRYCFLPDQFVINASDYDLFFVIHKCYREFIRTYRKE